MLWPALVFGLLGSFHCVGMCGALAMALPGDDQPGRWVLGRLAYHGGRIGTYAALGAAVGLVGRSLQLFGWQQGLSIASGVLILLLVVVPEASRARAAEAVGLGRPLHAVRQGLARWYGRSGAFALLVAGTLNGLLPCGLVYLALAGALSAPTVASAAAYMALFGVGTLPLLLALSLTGRLVPLALRVRMRQAVPWTAAALAVLFIVRGLGLGIPYLSPATAFSPVNGAQPAMCHAPR